MKRKEKYNVAIMGATGAVGLEFIKILEARAFPVGRILLLASGRSEGKEIPFCGERHKVELLTKDSFKDIDIVLASAGASRSREFLPYAVRAGAVCVDNSSAFRMEKDVPLVVPEVNAHAIKSHKGIIANPNCSTIQMVIPLCAISKKTAIKRVVVTTFQSVSGAGLGNIIEMESQIKRISEKESHYGVGEHNASIDLIKEFPHQIAYNLIPHIDIFLDNLYTREEMKMVHETRKILSLPDLPVSATCVRVPVYYAHSESVNIETGEKLAREEVIDLLRAFPGIKVVDEPKKNEYPMPIEAEGKDEVFVGRVREDESVSRGINMWVVADNLRKGAALNAIQIAELLAGA